MSLLVFSLVAWGLIWTAVAFRARSNSNRVQPLPLEVSGTNQLDKPLVSVLIAARDEATDIEACICSILAQEYDNLEIIAVNDHSRDQTGLILDRIAAGENRLHIIHNPPLEEGWLGKTNALRHASRIAQGSWLLFMDGDVLVERSTISRAMNITLKSGVNALSLLHTMVRRSWGETALVPIQMLTPFVIRLDMVNQADSREVVGTGSFMLVSRTAYETIGGHQAIRGSIVDDVDLARLIKRAGYGYLLLSGYGVLRVRSYPGGTGALVMGMAKNVSFLFGGVKGRPVRALLATLLLALYTSLPIVAAGYGTATGNLRIFLTGFIVYICPILISIRYASGFEVKWQYLFFYPVAAWLVVAAQAIASYFRIRYQSVFWRGRLSKTS